MNTLLLHFVLYLPWWLGGYNGASKHDVCQSMSKISATFWIRPNDEIRLFCHELIQQRIYSDILGIITVLFTICIWYNMYNTVVGSCIYCVKKIYNRVCSPHTYLYSNS
jgi:hypothetical protein